MLAKLKTEILANHVSCCEAEKNLFEKAVSEYGGLVLELVGSPYDLEWICFKCGASGFEKVYSVKNGPVNVVEVSAIDIDEGTVA
jgi:hypothetical protein